MKCKYIQSEKFRNKKKEKRTSTPTPTFVIPFSTLESHRGLTLLASINFLIFSANGSHKDILLDVDSDVFMTGGGGGTPSGCLGGC